MQVGRVSSHKKQCVSNQEKTKLSRKNERRHNQIGSLK